MENTDSVIIGKIQKLLALGKKNPNENEAQEAILKAHELMAEFGIETIIDENPKITYVREFCEHRGNREFRKMLAGVIAPNFRCRHFYQGGQVVFFGHTGDAKIAKEVFEYAYSFAYKESNRLAAQFRKDGYRSDGVINSYALGFICGLKEKLGEQSTALMVIVPPDVKDKYDEITKGFKKSKNRFNIGSGSSTAYNRGLSDGRTVMNGRKLKSAA